MKGNSYESSESTTLNMFDKKVASDREPLPLRKQSWMVTSIGTNGRRFILSHLAIKAIKITPISAYLLYFSMLLSIQESFVSFFFLFLGFEFHCVHQKIIDLSYSEANF